MRLFFAVLAMLSVLAVNGAHAGPLAPKPRVVAEYKRHFMEQTGAHTLGELLDTGIVRYFLTGGQSLLVMVDGRPSGTTDSDLGALPLAAIERIEVLDGGSLGVHGAGGVRGALNVVMRTDLNGFETRAGIRAPTRDGGDAWQGSAFWGGAVGKGRMSLGLDVSKRKEIASRHRAYSESVWVEGGNFADTQNISVGGNTVYIVQFEDDRFAGLRSVALGACDPANGYTGVLSNPPGIRNGDKGCGFAYGEIMWNDDRVEQKTAILNLDAPLGEDAELKVYANLSLKDIAFRYAPSVGVFSFTPNEDLLAEINAAAGETVADADDAFAVGHRFVRHGNRDWVTDGEAYDVTVSVSGRLTDAIGYDARLEAYRSEESLEGNTLVHGGRAREEILAGNYDLVNPFSNAPEHLQAIANTTLTEEQDAGSQYLGARLALEGSGFAIDGRDVTWTAGVELASVDAHDLLRFRDNDGQTYDVSQVLGSGGISYEGDRNIAAAFAEMVVPLTADLDIRVGGRGSNFDDIGTLQSVAVGAEYRPTGLITLRSSWSAGDLAPGMLHLYSTEQQDHPYIECDPGAGPPPRSCTERNSLQVERRTSGNPNLDPSNAERLAIGAEARKGPFFLGVDWTRLKSTGLAGTNSADWAMANLQECAEGGATTDCIQRTGGDIVIYDSFANVTDTEVSGVNVRFGGGMRTELGIVGLRGAWRYVTNSKLRIAGESSEYPVPRNAARLGLLWKRGDLSVIWTVNHRSDIKNAYGSGRFKSWTGHDLTLSWADPFGLQGALVTAGVLNATDAQLSVNTANPHSVDGPVGADWGRTLFLTARMRF